MKTVKLNWPLACVLLYFGPTALCVLLDLEAAWLLTWPGSVLALIIFQWALMHSGNMDAWLRVIMLASAFINAGVVYVLSFLVVKTLNRLSAAAFSSSVRR